VIIFEPNLDLLRQAFGNSIQDCHAELIKIALGWSRVYRVTLKIQGHSTRDPVIVKTINPNGPPTALEAERELRFYQTILSGLCIPKPKVYFLATDPETGFHIIIMEDLSSTHRIPTHPYQWTRDELRSVLRAYAYLHADRVANLDYAWLAPRHENLLNLEKIPEQVAIVQRAGIWGDLPELSDLIAFADESVGLDGLIDDDSIEQLKSFCRGEMSAVETYRHAIAVAGGGWVAEHLRLNLASHSPSAVMDARPRRLNSREGERNRDGCSTPCR